MSEAKPSKQGRSRSPSEVIHALMCEMHDLRQSITPELLAEKTGYKPHTVKDALERLREQFRVARVRPGFYEPTAILLEPRAISVTMIPRAHIKVEIGDTIINLTPEEARSLAIMLNGYGLAFTQVEQGSVAAHLASEVETRVRQIAQRMADLEAFQRPPGALASTQRCRSENSGDL